MGLEALETLGIPVPSFLGDLGGYLLISMDQGTPGNWTLSVHGKRVTDLLPPPI